MIDFMKFKSTYFFISSVLVLTALASIFVWGLKPAIDFTGGALIEVSISDENVSSDDLSQYATNIESVDVSSVQKIQDTNNYVLRTNTIDENKKAEILSEFKNNYSNVVEVRFETVGPTLGRELLIKTGVAIFLASILILFYVARQFKDRIYGVSAILAMFHDTLILIGAFAIFGHFYEVEVDTLFVTAVLTTLSFSVHDTIVVFDRVRESLHDRPNLNPYDVINKAVTETLSRSINNSMTIIFMLTALSLLGGVTIRWFSVALLIGTVIGTYSSTFTAAPLLLILMRRRRQNS